MLPEELNRLAHQIADEHEDVIHLACLVLIVRNRLDYAQNGQGLDTTPLRTTGQELIDLYARVKGIETDRIEAAICALQRAGVTAQYLSAIPD